MTPQFSAAAAAPKHLLAASQRTTLRQFHAAELDAGKHVIDLFGAQQNHLHEEPRQVYPNVERRGPSRTKNLKRPNFGCKPTPAATIEPSADPMLHRTGTDGDWASF